MGQFYNFDGFGYSVSGTNITITNYTGSGGAVTIPSSIPGVEGTVTAIGGSAFWFAFRVGLNSVTVPSSVTSIGDDAFAYCSGLSSITIPSSVTDIGNAAFFYCSGLSSITIPNGVTNIGNYAFIYCSGLTNLTITIPSSVTSIGAFAFVECGLSSITIPSSVTSIRDYAFAACTGLTNAFFQGNALSGLGYQVFDDTAPHFSIYYPSTASGWSTPTWNGYPAQPYVPLLTLTLGSGAVTPSFNWLLLGTNYQLQVSTDLITWSNTGPAFTATNASAAYAQPFNVGDWNQLFFRLVSAP